MLSSVEAQISNNKFQNTAMINKDFLPIAIDITDKKILIVGGGQPAFDKILSLQKYSNNIFVVDRYIKEDIKNLGVKFTEKEYEFEDIFDSFLIFAYTEDDELNQKIREDGDKAGKLVNVYNNPTLGNFESPAVFKKSNISIAVSSNGVDKSRSTRIVNSIQQIFQHDLFLLD